MSTIIKKDVCVSEEIKVVEKGRLNKEAVLAKLKKKHGSSVRFIYFYYVS